MHVIRYQAPGWGTGELWLEDGLLVNHELPSARVGGETESHPLAERMLAYFAGERVDFGEIGLDLEWMTAFQRAVAETLRQVPYGEVVTYGELAALAGYPNAQRAAGSFCAGNRFPILVPCHRVVAANGLGPYGSLGTDYKRRLLALEGVAE